MEEILTYLKEKNHYLKKFYTLNKAELFRFSDGDFSRVDYFYKSRDNMLDMIAHIEQLLEKELAKYKDTSVIPKESKKKIKDELDYKDSVINEILNQDLQILALIDAAKSNIIRELQEVNKTKAVASAYHSGGANPRHRLAK